MIYSNFSNKLLNEVIEVGKKEITLDLHEEETYIWLRIDKLNFENYNKYNNHIITSFRLVRYESSLPPLTWYESPNEFVLGFIRYDEELIDITNAKLEINYMFI